MEQKAHLDDALLQGAQITVDGRRLAQQSPSCSCCSTAVHCGRTAKWWAPCRTLSDAQVGMQTHLRVVRASLVLHQSVVAIIRDVRHAGHDCCQTAGYRVALCSRPSRSSCAPVTWPGRAAAPQRQHPGGAWPVVSTAAAPSCSNSHCACRASATSRRHDSLKFSSSPEAAAALAARNDAQACAAHPQCHGCLK